VKDDAAQKVAEVPQGVVSSAPVNTDPPDELPKETSLVRKPIFWVLVLITLLVAIFSVGVVGAFAVAYQGVSFGNKTVDNLATGLVMSLPFVPKTPKYVLGLAIKNFQSISKMTVNATLSYEGERTEIAFGENKFVAEVSGRVDYLDKLNPKFQITSSVNKELVFQVRKPEGSQIYFKLDKIPDTWVKRFLGSTTDLSGVIPYWVNYDLTATLTGAKGKNQWPEVEKEVQRRLEEGVQQRLPLLENPRIRSAIVVSEATEEGRKIYRLVFKPDDSLADYFFDKLWDVKTGSLKQSKTIKNLQISISVDREKMLVSRIIVSSDYLTPSKSFLMNQYLNIIAQGNGEVSLGGDLSRGVASQSSPSAVMTNGNDETKTAIKLDLRFKDFNQSIQIERPNNTMSFENYWKKIVETSTTLKKSMQLSNDSRRRADLQRLQQSFQRLLADSKGWPELEAKVPKNKLFDLSSKSSFGVVVCKVLVPKYTIQIPFDVQTGNWTSCDQFHSGYGLMVGSYRTGEMPKITLTAVGELKKSIVSVE
jgi:hypothetical protein